jgi:hypothetical protein
MPLVTGEGQGSRVQEGQGVTSMTCLPLGMDSKHGSLAAANRLVHCSAGLLAELVPALSCWPCCSIDLPKYILTNADQKHAEMCLDRLGIRDCFKV